MAALSMHNMRPARGAKSKRKRLGRGNASGKGTTAGRGGKGQTARAGGRNKLKLLGMRHLMLQTPKLRGFKSPHAKSSNVSISAIDKTFADGATVSPASLAKRGLVPAASSHVKILDDGGALRKKVSVVNCKLSATAKEKILAAGGTVK